MDERLDDPERFGDDPPEPPPDGVEPGVGEGDNVADDPGEPGPGTQPGGPARP